MPEPAPLVVVGDALLDRDLNGESTRLAPDAPAPVVERCEERVRPGGAALAALLAARRGRHVTLLSPLGEDPASRLLCRLLDGHVNVVPLPMAGALQEKTRILARGRLLTRYDQGDGTAGGEVTAEALAAVASARAILVADYGRGCAGALRDALAESARRTPLVWDPHPRGGRPVTGTRLCVPTESEAIAMARAINGPAVADPHGCHALRATAAAAETLADAWEVASVAVTLGERGALLTQSGSPLLVPAPDQHERDACGAGDCFAATAAGRLGDGALPEEAVRDAVEAATAYVAGGGAAAVTWEAPAAGPLAAGSPYPLRGGAPPAGTRTAPGTISVSDRGREFAVSPTARPRWDAALRLAARVRAQGGTVVATGGCFDLLHAGHIKLLQDARRTGDCLIVCLNSDASVRRRKGEHRPINHVEDRARVLSAIEGVDAIAVFEEDTPERLLSELRPHLWVKGGDYALSELPEAAQLEQWGGQAALLPYLDGRSTSNLAARVRGRAA